jgi:succinate dehydrogenase/fumarate reductase flavoprotein subunit
MDIPIPRRVLDDLTDVEMPRGLVEGRFETTHAVAGRPLPLHRVEVLVLGSGAAGLRAAVELARRGVAVSIASRALWGGTSACSGSDKQTLHTASTRGHGDDFLAVAESLGRGGAMDADTAYVEAVGSIPAMAGLQFLGLPLPQDRFGAVLRYQTDHDEAGRGTSCGPRTSRLMVKVLAQEAARLAIPVFNRVTAVRILICEGRVVGLLAIDPRRRGDGNPHGFVVFACRALVLAGGGPGELYRDSVYPRQCFGVLGLALEAGLDTVNLTESQFGIGTPREDFPWNLSGTYVQCIPYVHSVDAEGREYDFLSDYYRTTRELASNVFRKGYQWPFDARRMVDWGSSLVDLAIHREARAGRRVLMDFTRNPRAVPGDVAFSLDRLDDDVRGYLADADALLPTPIERLRRMNPLSIELFARYRHDLTREPLAFNVNHQHMNGGIAVDVWGRTSVEGCYAIGEAAGTHGVTRPGGAALIAGQVFALRAATHIRAHAAGSAPAVLPDEAIAAEIGWIETRVGATGGLDLAAVATAVQARMSDEAGFLCRPEGVETALAEARALDARIAAAGFREPSSGRLDVARAVLWRQTALASEAVLTALSRYLEAGGGSRGARAICTPQGDRVPQSRTGSLEAYRFVGERLQDRDHKIHVRRRDGELVVEVRPLRPSPTVVTGGFEKNWAAFVSGEIFDDPA